MIESATEIKGLELVLEGGDERTSILPETGRNKYHLHPLHYDGLFNRGSCTNSTLNRFSAGVLANFLDRIRNRPFAEIRRNQELRLKALLNLGGEDNFECFFAPSGSDLAYLPLMFARILYPTRPIINLLTCPEELGAGTLLAAEGRYYMSRNQFGEATPQGQEVATAAVARVMHFAARNDSGAINDHRSAIIRAIDQNADAAVIGSLVIGSKSGIEDNVDVVVKDISSNSLWVVDLCQFRNSKRLIKKLLDMGCMVMVTGSKFYESPPFCAVMLLPKPLIERVARCDPSAARHFDRIFAAEDCPASLPGIRSHLRSCCNIGLLARWECALVEMEAFESLSVAVSQSLIVEWNSFVIEQLRRHESFDLIPSYEVTNPTIISFRVCHDGYYFGKTQLDKLFRQLVLGKHEGFVGYDRVSIGQPVNYGDRSFIRFAIGSHGIRELLSIPRETRYDNDSRLVQLVDEMARRLGRSVAD